MRIHALHIEGFGIWTDLRLEGLEGGLNVFFGPNEAGKTTLMQFVRSVLYGFNPERRRYFPPRYGGRHGGRLRVAGPQGQFVIGRFDRSDQGQPSEELTLTSADGLHHGESALRALLCQIDEAIYNHVFAIGLEELQQLGALQDTEAAALLYRLSAGMDRVSLIEVMRDLHASRNRLWDASGGPSLVPQLFAERERLRGEVEQTAALATRYGRLAAEREQLDREIGQLEEESRQLTYQLRVLELAQALRPRFEARAAIDEQLAALQSAEDFAEAELERFDRLGALLEQRQKQWDELRGQWLQLREEAQRLAVSAKWLRHGPQIEALAAQEDWFRTLGGRIEELDAEIASAEREWADRCDQLKMTPKSLAGFSPRSLQTLRPAAQQLRRCRQRLEEARSSLAAGQQTEQSLAEQIRTSLEQRGERELSEAMERLGTLVSQLRRRLHLDERLEQIDQHQEDVQEQMRMLWEHRVLPGSTLVGVGALFVVGVSMGLAAAWEFVLPGSLVGPLAGPMAVLGLLSVGAAVLVKHLYQRSNARELEHMREQLHRLRAEMIEARQERDALDRQLPPGTGTIASRLEAAERQLAALEELAPLDAQREALRQQSDVATRQVQEATADLAEARRRWHEAVVAAGLPPGLSPKQVRQLADQASALQELQQRLDRLRAERDQRAHELDALASRITQLAASLELSASGRTPQEQLHVLLARLREQQDRWKRRRALSRQAWELRRKGLRVQLAVVRLKRRRRLILDRTGARDEVEFRRRAADKARATQLRAERNALQREIEAALAGFCPEEVVRQPLETATAAQGEAEREALQRRLESCTAQLKQRYEKRGQLAEQLKALADNRAPAAKRLQWAAATQRLDQAIRRWQVLALVHQLLDRVRKTYEQSRQPETLQQASGYFQRLTLGRYRRVWTPLDDDVLLVDEGDGKPVRVEWLSRGVREQLFLALRLALADTYARRGVDLPLILDDVLVNFDSQRARAAAELLGEFASRGHQVLVFTCHEHIAAIFGGLGVQVTQLPERGGSHESVVASQRTLVPQAPEERQMAEPGPRPSPQPPPPARKQKPLVRPSEPPPPRITERLPPWEDAGSEPPDPPWVVGSKTFSNRPRSQPAPMDGSSAAVSGVSLSGSRDAGEAPAEPPAVVAQEMAVPEAEPNGFVPVGDPGSNGELFGPSEPSPRISGTADPETPDAA